MVGREFKYLEEIYGVSGAREVFEKICTSIIDNGCRVEPYPGDDGIDIIERNGCKISVYQCKFFTERVNDSQKKQIKESFKSLMKSIHKDNVESWTLCIPTTLTSKEMNWINKWFLENEKELNIKMNLMDKDQIINKLHEKKIYDRYFSTLTIDQGLFNSFNNQNYISSLSPLMNEIARNDFRYSTIEFILLVEDIVNKYEYDPRFMDSSLIDLLDNLIKVISFNAHDGIIRDKQILNDILEIRKNILSEYKRLFK